MKYPEKLNQGDCVGLICPSSQVSTEKKEKSIQFIEDLGFQVKAADNLDRPYGGFMAGTGKERAAWIHKMFEDPEVKAIFCLRGGDGAGRLVEHLDFEIIKNNPKIFVGYSDVTFIHLGISQFCNFVSFHGPMVESNMIEHFDEDEKNSLFNAIENHQEYEFKNAPKEEIKILKPGIGRGEITGGNLSLLNASLGTKIDLDTDGKILFIEEVEEPILKFDKWLYQLKNAGKFEKCEGMIIGHITDCTNDFDPKYGILEVFEDVLADYDFPVIYNISSGHDFPMMTIPIGADCLVDGNNGKLIINPKK